MHPVRERFVIVQVKYNYSRSGSLLPYVRHILDETTLEEIHVKKPVSHTTIKPLARRYPYC